MDKTSLSLLNAAASSPDSEAWNQLTELYVPLLRYWLATYEVQQTDAEDLIQDVLIALSEELPNFKHSGRDGAFRKWMRVTLGYRVQNYWRQKKYRPVAKGGSSIDQMLEGLVTEDSEVSQQWEREHDELVVSKLLSQVKQNFEEKTWEAFQLAVVEGLPAAQVAQQLDISVDKVYVAKSRILRAVRSLASGLTT